MHHVEVAGRIFAHRVCVRVRVRARLRVRVRVRAREYLILCISPSLINHRLQAFSHIDASCNPILRNVMPNLS